MNILLDQHLTELESHNRELLAMNAKLRKENEHLVKMQVLHENVRFALMNLPVCMNDSCELKPLSEAVSELLARHGVNIAH